MHDMQERLIYLLDNYINEKLKRQETSLEEVKRIISGPGKGIDILNVIRIFFIDTLGDAIDLLEMCDGCLDREIVAGISIEIIQPCMRQLDKAKGFIEDQRQKEIFSVKNLFYLLEKLKLFNIELISHKEELDFTDTRENIIGVIFSPKKLKDYNWFGFINATLPKLQKSQRDLKKELIKKYEDSLQMLRNTCVSHVIPHIINYLSLCDIKDQQQLEHLKQIIKGEVKDESLNAEKIRGNMEETEKKFKENLELVIRIISNNFSGETYKKIRKELLTTIAQDITNSFQKLYDKLAVLTDSIQYESLSLPNIKTIYEAINNTIGKHTNDFI